MIMEYVEGTTLASRLQQGDMRYADALVCFDQVLAALSCAHSQRIVHRDIKPANIMLAPYGIVKLMDFGIARSGNDMGLTMTGTTLGSVAYMSPEQVRCEPLDGRSDLYSVGVSLYETITGQRPYVSDNNFEVMQAHLQVPPTAPIDLKPDIPPGLNQLILMAMAKNPAQRFQTADAMRGALRSVAPVLGEPTPFAPRFRESTMDMSAPADALPCEAQHSAFGDGAARGAQPITARPVTARPVTLGPSRRSPLRRRRSRPHLRSCRLRRRFRSSGSAHQYPQAQVPAAAVASRPERRKRKRVPAISRGLYITLSASGRARGVGCCGIRRETLDGFAVVRKLHYCAGGQSAVPSRQRPQRMRRRAPVTACDASLFPRRDPAPSKPALARARSRAQLHHQLRRIRASTQQQIHAATDCAAASWSQRCSTFNRAAGPSRGGTIRAENRGIRRAARSVGA